MGNYRFHRDLGSFLNGLFTLIIVVILFHYVGEGIINKIIIAFVAYAVSYPLVGLLLRSLGVWKR